SQARSVIRPGQYGYGRVPSNFQLNGAMAHLLQTTPGRRHVADEGGSHQTAGSDISSQRRWGASRVQRASEGQPEGSIEGLNWQVADGQAWEAPVSSSPLTEPRQISFAKTLDPEEGDGPANSPHPEDQLSSEEPSRGVRHQRDLWPLTADETWSLRPSSQASRELSFTSLDGPASWVLDTSESIKKVREDAVGGSAHRRRPRAQPQSQIDPQTGRRRHLSPELAPATAQQRQGVIVRKGERRASPAAEFPPAEEGTLVRLAYNESSRPGLRVQAKGSKERRRNRQASGQRVSRPRRQNYGGPLDLGAESHQDWNPHQWPTASCPGADKQYKTCSVSPCLSGETDPRKVQCARFNNLQFMGRYYKWEPFTE
ncbi:hypothetical protein chiPu_0022216, partial [Chiloscyllium punctatum]|nr:hypothetical protein [Chiloscyllium punctatum]